MMKHLLTLLFAASCLTAVGQVESICGCQDENSLSVNLELSAPDGFKLGDVLFASYGTPTGDCENGFATSGCHAGNSVSIIESYISDCTTSLSVYPNNSLFGDPCYTVGKKLCVEIAIEPIVTGCMNADACNFDSEVNCDDGSCLYLPPMTLPESVVTCDDVVTLVAPEGYDSYSWSTSETTPSVQITESGTYTVEGHVFGSWGWVTGEEVSVTFWNTLQEAPNEGCAEMYSSDGFHIADCSEAKLFVLEFDSMEEFGGGDDLSIDGFTYVNPEDMLECNSGLDVGLSSVYFLSTEALSFGEAQSICEGLGGHLVSINSEEENNFVANIDGCFLGCGNDCPGFWIGLEREVCSSASSVEVTFSIEGCTNPEACNYNAEASCDNGTCASCEALATACGTGTVWDPISLSCIVANPADTNLDGCVQLNDLLDVLSAYGDCAAEESAWQCGDPVEYQGYDYETVQIGEQCWFAENLRAENYSNGDPIIEATSNAEWVSVDEGAFSVYLNEFYYNGFSSIDERGVCPQGWNSGSDGAWIALAEVVGGLDSAGDALRSQSWKGSNESGFSGFPSGYRRWSDGQYRFLSERAFFWTETLDGESLLDFRVYGSSDEVIVASNSTLKDGFSIRCIQDAE